MRGDRRKVSPTPALGERTGDGRVIGLGDELEFAVASYHEHWDTWGGLRSRFAMLPILILGTREGKSVTSSQHVRRS